MIAIGPTLEELGIAGKPEAMLVRDGAFFVLVDDLLIYRDEAKLRRISLRDLTRIHSDDTGVLRIETPVGVALSASLLGFDPDAVQPFFLRVRDATAYAKAQAKREQARKEGAAPPSPFAGVPRAAPAAQVAQFTKATDSATESEEFEPYAPYERPRSFGQEVGERLGSVVRVIRRRPQQQEQQPESSIPAQFVPATPPASSANSEPSQPVPAPVAAQPSPPSQPRPAAGLPAGAAPVLGSVSMEEAFRGAAAPVVATPQQAAPPATQPVTRPYSAAPTQPTNSEEAVQVPPKVTLKSLGKAIGAATTTTDKGAAPVTEHSPSTVSPQVSAKASAKMTEETVAPTQTAQTVVKALTHAAQPQLGAWPVRLRVVAGVLLLTAIGLTVYYLLAGAVASALWLAVVGGSGAVFLLAAADALQVLAQFLPEAESETVGSNKEHY